jgi:hypothetical protein
MITVNCPNSNCGSALSAADSLRGNSGKCPYCGTKFSISPEGETSIRRRHRLAQVLGVLVLVLAGTFFIAGIGLRYYATSHPYFGDMEMPNTEAAVANEKEMWKEAHDREQEILTKGNVLIWFGVAALALFTAARFLPRGDAPNPTKKRA